jgi:hypothetical protein
VTTARGRSVAAPHPASSRPITGAATTASVIHTSSTVRTSIDVRFPVL